MVHAPADPATPQALHFSSLPLDVLEHVAGFLSVKDCARAACTTRGLRAATAARPAAVRDELRRVMAMALTGRRVTETLPSACVAGAEWVAGGTTTRGISLLTPCTCVYSDGLCTHDSGWAYASVGFGPPHLYHTVDRGRITPGFAPRPRSHPAFPPGSDRASQHAALYLRHLALSPVLLAL